MKNILIYAECFYKNKFVFRAFVCLLLGILILKYGNMFTFLPGFLLVVFSLIVLMLLRFGWGTYRACKKVYKHMLDYDETVDTDVYCADVGNNIAKRRFAKDYPLDYQRIIEKENALRFMMNHIQIHIFFGR